MGIFDQAETPSSSATTPDLSSLEAYAKDVALLQTQAKAIKDSLEDATDALIAALPHANKEVGETSIIAGKYQININTGERWTWNQEQLTDILGADPALPDCAKVKVAIDKKKFESADTATRNQLLSALTRSPSKPKLTIEAI